jgi:putative transposase
VSTTITRLYGRAPQGEPLTQKVLHGNWKTVTFIAALRHDRVTAPFVLEGAMNGETFKAYVEQFLAPTLKKGDIVFMDNASVHMAEGVEEAIAAKGAILFYLPAYSPDFNPIEQLFAKLKSMLRKIAAYSLKQTAYTVDSLCKAIASSLTEITRSECAAYLAQLPSQLRIWSILSGNALAQQRGVQRERRCRDFGGRRARELVAAHAHRRIFREGHRDRGRRLDKERAHQ